MFLHFGELHLIFNMLWLWYFGRQLEAIHPRWLFIVLIILASFVSNTTQYLSSNFNNFGGMSGVVYGLVGYTWLVHTLMPRSKLQIRGSMFAVFVAALVLMEILASSWIATAAHIGGLLSGLLLGLGVAGFYRLVLKRDLISRSGTS
jgi:GlpG protein